MDVTLLGIVSDLTVNLKSPLSEVTNLAFERLIDGTIASELCEDICGPETDINKVLANCIPPGFQPLEKFLTVTVILAISSPKNNRYFVKLLQHFNRGTDSLIEKLLNELELYGQSSSLPDEVDLSNQVPPLRVSRQSSVEQLLVLQLDIEATSSDAKDGPEQTVQSTNDLERHTLLVEDTTELSLPSFRTEDEYEDPSWIAPERLEIQPTPSKVFGTVGKVDYLPRGSDGPMCALTPLLKPALPSSLPTNEDNRAGTKKRYRPATPYPGDRIHAESPSSSPLTRKGEGDAELPWRNRTRSAKNMLPLLGPSLLSQPPRRKPRRVSRVPQVPLAKSSPSTPKSSPSKPSLLKQAPKRNASGKVPPLSHQNPSDESLSFEDKTSRSYQEFAPHIPLQIGSSKEGQFNMFRVDPRSNRTILTPTVIKELLQGADTITRKIWLSPILDDSRLRFRLGGGSKDFLDLPHVGSRIMDVASIISRKIDINNESTVLWKFFRYCVLRVEDVNTGGNAALRKELVNISHKTLLGYLRATRRPIASDILLHTLNVCELPPLNDSNHVKTLLECVVHLLKSTNVGNKVVTKALAGASPKRVDPKFSKEKLEHYKGMNICNEPPAKRQRLGNTDSGYSSGPSDTSPRVTRNSSRLETHDVFSYKVDLLAEQIENSEPIVAKATKNQLYESYCYGKSICELKPGGFLGDDLIDTLIGLLSAAEDSVYLGSKFYSELLKKGYGNTRKWIQGKGQKSGRWFFPIYKDSGSVVIGVNLYMGEIEYYDPQCSSYFATKRRDEHEIIIKDWLKDISNTKRSWNLIPIGGPQQEKGDSSIYP
ncbi:hypothetical protein G7Y89_g1263 [Cudoniella acicularis]|uniref:Uncharacterized protein n=1 Tax=Cudoniella acicularis TaxID=354080 RepID=A0A8H4RWP3_9HELO|nr:hypothetical protein G7Y89_g1263 [Cudoniella acicularis]